MSRCTIGGCGIASLVARDGPFPKSGTACGAWPDGPAARIKNPSSRSIGPSSSAATSSTPPGPTATATASGCSGETLRRHPDKRLYVATKIPPKNRKWPARPEYKLEDVFPADYIREYTEKSLENIGVDTLDLQQFHVWDDTWATDERWQKAFAALKEQKLARAIGISINRFQPANVLKALETGLIDAVQVVYNTFDQNPEDELFPVCQERGIAVIARVPFDEGSLTGNLTADSRWPEGDFRNLYFHPENLRNTLPRVERLRAGGSRGHDDAADGAAPHPGASGGVDGDSGHAQAAATSSRTSGSATGSRCPQPSSKS